MKITRKETDLKYKKRSESFYGSFWRGEQRVSDGGGQKVWDKQRHRDAVLSTAAIKRT